MSFDVVWSRIQAHQGEVFHQVRGGEFTYYLSGQAVRPDRTNRLLPRSQFEKALKRFPVGGPGDLYDLQGPSYLYAILTDERISRRDRPV
jgi:hypothetical protein